MNIAACSRLKDARGTAQSAAGRDRTEAWGRWDGVAGMQARLR